MPYYKDTENKPHFLDDSSFEYLLPKSCVQISDAEYADLTNPAPTLDQIREKYERAAQSLLDSTAMTWGYDSIISAASYAASGVAQYKADAQALIGWRDQLWQAAYGVEVSVQGGTAMPATAAEFLAMLPAAPTRPVA